MFRKSLIASVFAAALAAIPLSAQVVVRVGRRLRFTNAPFRLPDEAIPGLLDFIAGTAGHMCGCRAPG